MATLKDRMEQVVRGVRAPGHSPGPPEEPIPVSRAAVLEQQVAELEQRAEGLEQRAERLELTVAELSQQLMESRRINRRLAELTDVVQELLLPVAQRDEQRLGDLLDRYRDSL